MFRYDLLIRESHLDTFGHVNNATYLDIFEEARWDFITAGGFGLEYIQRSRMGPTILEIEIKYKRELTLRQHVTIESEVLNYEGKICRLRQCVLIDGKDLACEAVFIIGLFDLEKRKLILPTAEWLKALGYAEDSA